MNSGNFGKSRGQRAIQSRSNHIFQWENIIRYLSPELANAINNRPNHVPCPMHGGQDGLRCFDDFDETGGMICNTCGPFPNGYLVLAWVLDLPTKEVAQIIRKVLRNWEIQSAKIH